MDVLAYQPHLKSRSNLFSKPHPKTFFQKLSNDYITRTSYSTHQLVNGEFCKEIWTHVVLRLLCWIDFAKNWTPATYMRSSMSQMDPLQISDVSEREISLLPLSEESSEARFNFYFLDRISRFYECDIARTCNLIPPSRFPPFISQELSIPILSFS